MKSFYTFLKSLVLITCVFMTAGAQKAWAVDYYDFEYYLTKYQITEPSDGELKIILCSNTNYTATNNYRVQLQFEVDKATKVGNTYSYSPDGASTCYLIEASTSRKYYFKSFEVNTGDNNDNVEGTGIIIVSGEEKRIYFTLYNTNYANYSSNKALTELAENASYSDGEWTVKITKNATSYLELHISGDENGFNASSEILDKSQICTNSNYGNFADFTGIRDVTLEGNPTIGHCEIHGFFTYSSSSYARVHCVLDNDTPYVPEDHHLNISSMNSYYSGGWDITLRDSNGDNVSLLVNTGAKEKFAGTYTLSNCNPTSTKCHIGDKDYTFTDLGFTISGSNEVARIISGNGHLNNGDFVDFSYSDPTKDIASFYAKESYITFFNQNKAVILPSEVDAMVAYMDSEICKFAVEYTGGSVIPAGVPVILVTEPSESDQNFDLAYTTGGTDPSVENRLRGTSETLNAGAMAAKEDEACMFYALSCADNDLGDKSTMGFYWRADDGMSFDYTTPGKAYLALPKTGVTPARILFNESISGISTINSEAQPTVTFNLNGQRINEAKGLTIRNGKMMFVK